MGYLLAEFSDEFLDNLSGYLEERYKSDDVAELMKIIETARDYWDD